MYRSKIYTIFFLADSISSKWACIGQKLGNGHFSLDILRVAMTGLNNLKSQNFFQKT